MEILKRKGTSLARGLACFVMLLLPGVAADYAWATHAATTNGEIEGRPAPVFRRICLSGTSAGNYCKQDSDCPGSACTGRNVYNITVAVMYDAPAADITSIKTLIGATSQVLMDVTDGQAEIGIATIHNNAIGTGNADLVVHPSSNETWWQANSGHYRTGGFMEVSINHISNPANQGNILAHEFSHLVFDVRDEYESRAANCGAVVAAAACPSAAANDGTCLMDGNGTEFCWGHGDPAHLTDLTGGNHDPSLLTEQSSCRSNRSCWDQVVWSWPKTFLKPVAAPDPAASGASADPVKFIVTSDQVRVVLVLDESGSMSLESPSRIERLRVAARDFIATAQNDAEVGLVSYSTDANTANGHERVSIGNLLGNRATLETALTQLQPNGWTNIGDGLQKAKDLVVAAGGVTANTYVVLMTDGLNNRPAPQGTADADLQGKVADLLAAGIPVYVTCTGGDFGLQSQCAEIGSGTNGFYSDSANAARLAENFVDFQQKIAGYQAIDSVTGDLAKIVETSSKEILVDKGSEAVSFALLWEHPKAGARLVVKDPAGNVYQGRPIPQGMYLQLDKPKPGIWQMIVERRSTVASPYVARAYTHNRINSVTASLRKPTVKPREEMYIYAIARSAGGTVTNPKQKLTATVTLPDGSIDTVDLYDNGRDRAGHGDDMAGDGIYTGVFKNTVQKGAYGFRIKAVVDRWQPGEAAHRRDARKLSPRFNREIRVAAGVSEPKERVTKPEDGHGIEPCLCAQETPAPPIRLRELGPNL